MDTLNSEQIVQKIIQKLYEDRRFRPNTLIDLKRATEDRNFLNKLFVRVGDNLTDSITDFLNYHNDKEMRFYNDIDKKVHRIGSLNPHDKPDPYEAYFVTQDAEGHLLEHLQKLSRLLEKDERTETLLLEEHKNILHIGEKGSGKTISQNVWLYRQNNTLEENNIVWIRLDARKLMDIWETTTLDNKSLITPEIYILGQLVYVFSKHFQEKYTNTYSELFGRIANALSQSKENNLSYYNFLNDDAGQLTKATSILHGLDLAKVFNAASKKSLKTIFDYLVYFEKIISIDEGTYIDDGEKRRDSKEKTDTSRSYLINVLSEAQKQQTTNYAEWITIGKLLRDFILQNDYSILYIIDGLDNINYFHKDRKEYLKKILHLLYDFPLQQSSSNKKELLLMSLRPTTYEALKKIHNKEHHRDVNQYKKVEDFYKIRQKTDNLLKPIIDKRIDYMLLNSKYKDCFMAKVLKTIQENHIIPEEERWHKNLRCFLYNHINLAKFITFKYYFAGQPANFDIKKQIRTYEDTNFLLNGYLFVWEKEHPSNSNAGHDCFNLFRYTNVNKMPVYFIYTYILQLIKNHEPITTQRICDILTCFANITKTDCRDCIDKLVSSGMILQEYSNQESGMQYEITTKGSFALKNFYNDIHFLYYTSLDTKVPQKLLNSFSIAPNNFSSETESRNYPPYCIITGIYFLRYLIRQNKKNITDKTAKSKLQKQGINISIFQLPVNQEELSKSIKTMVDTINKNSNHKQILINWLSKSNS